jgi:hypothetical protein
MHQKTSTNHNKNMSKNINKKTRRQCKLRASMEHNKETMQAMTKEKNKITMINLSKNQK